MVFIIYVERFLWYRFFFYSCDFFNLYLSFIDLDESLEFNLFSYKVLNLIYFRESFYF